MQNVIGYAREDAARHRPQKQIDRLLDAGCVQVFQDRVTGTKADRPGWDRCVASLRPGDTLIVTRLDRIGRSLVNLLDTVVMLHKRGVNIRALDQAGIDTTAPNGKLLFQTVAALSGWESTIDRERKIEGLTVARGRKRPGRGPSITAEQIQMVEELARTTTMSAGRIAAAIGVSRSTLYRHVNMAQLRRARR